MFKVLYDVILWDVFLLFIYFLFGGRLMLPFFFFLVLCSLRFWVLRGAFVEGGRTSRTCDTFLCSLIQKRSEWLRAGAILCRFASP